MDKVKTEHVGRASTGHQPRLQLAACEICTKLVTPDGTLEPCRCRTKWCNDCIRKVFLRAIKEPAAMPPKCCNPRRMFLIHLALPGLSSQEAATYRDRFDEWSASVKIYCPNPRCSAFISERLRPHTGAQAQPVPDSQPTTSLNLQEAATNTQEPTTENSLAVTCPSCSLRICMNCKQKQHVNAPCSTPPDQPVRDLVQRAGYKLCPSCGTGIKRMYGCVSTMLESAESQPVKG